MTNVKLKDVLDYVQPTKYIVSNEKYNDEYDIPVLTAGKTFILGYTDEKNGIYKASKENPIILFDDFTTDCRYIDFDFKVKSSAVKILTPKTKDNIKYLYYLIKNIEYDTTSHKRYWISQYSNFSINLPSIEIQNEIVKKIENIEYLIFNKNEQKKKLDELIKSQFVEMFDGKFKEETLDNLCDVRDGTHDSPKYLSNSPYRFITSKNITNGKIDFTECKYISEDDYNKFNLRSKVNFGDILMPMIGTIGNPIIVKIKDDKIDFAIKNVALIKFFENSKVNNIYINEYLKSSFFETYVESKARGGTQNFISLTDIRKIPIKVPAIKLQNKFASFVEQIDKQKLICEKEIKKVEELRDSKIQEYFGGVVNE